MFDNEDVVLSDVVGNGDVTAVRPLRMAFMGVGFMRVACLVATLGRGWIFGQAETFYQGVAPGGVRIL